MSLKIDRLQLEIIVNNDQARKSLRALEEESRQLTQEMRKLDKATAEWASKDARLKEIRLEMDKIQDSIGLTGLTMKELTAKQKELNAVMRQMDPRSKDYKTLEDKLRAVNGRIGELRDNAKQSQSAFGKFADQMNRFQTVIMMGAAAVAGLGAALFGMINKNAELSDSMADVAKSTGLTMNEVRELNSELRSLNTRTPRKELLDLAYVAGKLGYTSKADILGFVKAADQIGVSLSKDLGGNVEEAVNNLGKITDLFKIKDQFGIEQALLKTGSAINALGAASSASEAYIVEFTKRMGGVAPLAGVSAENIMGLAATLDQLGQTSEMSSTAVSQLLTKMFKKPGEFAAIAGLDIQKFSLLLRTDANEALIQFLTGLQKNKGGMAELAANFKDLGIDGSRAIGVIGALSNNIQILRDSQALSNAEFQKGTSLTNEFNIKNDNMAANLAKVERGLMGAFVNSSIMTGLEKIVRTMASWFEIPMSRRLEEERIKVNMLASELMEANIPAEQRNKLYDELKALAPEVLQGINKEAIAVDQLTANLERYNEQMINSIIIQKKQEQIDDANKKVASHREDRIKQEDEVRRALIRARDESYKNSKEAGEAFDKIWFDQAKTLSQKARAIEQLAFQRSKEQKYGMGFASTGKTNVLEIYEEEEAAALLKVNNLLKDKKQLMIDLKIESKPAGSSTSSASTSSNPSVPTPFTPAAGDSPELAKAKTAYEQLSNSIEAYKTKIETLLVAKKKVPAEMQKEYDALVEQKKGIDDEIRKITEEHDAYKDLTTNISDMELAMRKLLAARQPIPLEMKRQYDALVNEKAAIDKEIDSITTQVDAYDKLTSHITSLQKQINSLVAAGKLVPTSLSWDLSQSQYQLYLIEEEVKKVSASIKQGPLGKLIEQNSRKAAIASLENHSAPAPAPGPTKNYESLQFKLGLNDPEEQKKFAISIAESTQSAIFNIVRDRQQAAFDHKMALLEKAKEKELSNKHLTEDQKNAIEAKYAKKEKALKTEAFKKQKAASIIQGIMNTALAVINALASGGPAAPALAIAAGIAGALETAVIASQPVPEYGRGRYTVTGANTGKIYSADFTGPARTAFYSRPSLVAETGTELIVDPATTRNLQMNYPEVLAAINFARVPQYATGRYVQTSSSGAPSFGEKESSEELIRAMHRFADAAEQLQKDGVKGNWSLFDLEQIQQKKKDLQSVTQL